MTTAAELKQQIISYISAGVSTDIGEEYASYWAAVKKERPGLTDEEALALHQKFWLDVLKESQFDEVIRGYFSEGTTSATAATCYNDFYNPINDVIKKHPTKNDTKLTAKEISLIRNFPVYKDAPALGTAVSLQLNKSLRNHAKLRDTVSSIIASNSDDFSSLDLYLNDPAIDYIASTDENEENPLHLAVRSRNVLLVKYILEKIYPPVNFLSSQNKEKVAAIINAQNNKGESCVHIAAAQGNAEILELFSSYGNVKYDIPDDTGAYPIHSAIVSAPSATVVKTMGQLTSAKNNITAINVFTGENIVHLLSKRSTSTDNALLETQFLNNFLSDHKDLANKADYEGNFPIHTAIRNGHKAVAEKILTLDEKQYKAVNTKNKQTTLHVAATLKEQSADFIKLLASKIDNINAIDNDGNTALHIACRENNFEAVQELLNGENINLNAINKSGQIADLLTTDSIIKELIKEKRKTAEHKTGYVAMEYTKAPGGENHTSLHASVVELEDLTTSCHVYTITQLTNEFTQDVTKKDSDRPAEYLSNRAQSYLISIEPHLDDLPSSPWIRALVGGAIGLAISLIIIVPTAGLGAIPALFALDVAWKTAISVTAALSITPAASATAVWTWRSASYTNAVAKNAQELVEPGSTNVMGIPTNYRPFY